MKIKEPALVSIIIPTYKRHKDLIRLLVSISKSDYPKNRLEIIIVDNAGDLSENDIKKVSRHIGVKLLRPNANLYCSGGRLYGGKNASGEYLFFIDDDNILAKDCIRLLVNGLDNSSSLGMVGPLMLIYKKRSQIWAAGAVVNSWGVAKHLYSGKDLGEVNLPEVITGIDYFPNAFMIKKSVLKKIPFDVINFPHNWSEPDFGLRLKKHGYLVATITKAHDWHNIDYGGYLTRTDSVKIYDQARSRVLFRKRFFDSRVDQLKFWFVIFPISTLYYIKAVMTSKDDKKILMFRQYLKGTAEAMRIPISVTDD